MRLFFIPDHAHLRMAVHYDHQQERPSVFFEEIERPSIISSKSHKSMTSLASIEEDVAEEEKGRKSSEWAFRPLKIKFKMKEFEKIYDRYVYRQQQQLLIFVSCLLSLIALITLFVFLGEEKVSLSLHAYMYMYMYLHTKLSGMCVCMCMYE